MNSGQSADRPDQRRPYGSRGAKLTRVLYTVLPLVVCAAVVYYLFFFFSLDAVVGLKIGGTFCGYVDSYRTVQEGRHLAEARISESTGLPCRLDCPVEYSFRHMKSPDFLSAEECAALFCQSAAENYREAYMLFVDDAPIAASESRETLEGVLDGLSEDLLAAGGDGFSRVELKNDVRIERRLCPIDRILPADEIAALLDSSAARAPEADDENGGFASFNVRASILPVPAKAAALPESAPTELRYQYIRSVSWEELVPWTTEYIRDPDALIGTEVVLCEGKDGVIRITNDIVCDENGEEIECIPVGSEVVIPVQNRQVKIGAKGMPEAVPTGTFITTAICFTGSSDR